MVMLWAVLLVNVATVITFGIVVTNQHQSVSESGSARDVARWLRPPTTEDGIVYMSAEAGNKPVQLLRNGIPVTTIAANTTAKYSTPQLLAPTSWRLVDRNSENRERWTDAEPTKAVLSIGKSPGIALTFDGGSDNNALNSILKTLKRNRVRATFFLTGKFIKRYPQAARRIVADGHEVGNHTWSHPHLTTYEQTYRQQTGKKVNREFLQNQLLRTERLFTAVTGARMAPYWRAPYGEYNSEILAWANALGYRHIGWTSHGKHTRSLDTLDWVDDPKDPLYVSGEKMATQVIALARKSSFNGGIVLMHVGTRRKHEQMHRELDRIINHLNDSEIPLYTISQLINKASRHDSKKAN